tara:strand:- start:271 stop:1008 length:738 start_codon:yes stop_codon:yes gene_type:complete
MIGSSLSSAGVAILNEYIEREQDAIMNRTRKRPLPSGRIAPKRALFFGIAVSVIGVLELALMVNLYAGILSFITIAVYLFIYTPIKQKSPWNTLIGAVPGALPPVGGWLAATGNITNQTIIVFCILFFWQIPHFFAIAWLYKKDYNKAGFKMFMTDPNDRFRSNILLVGFCVMTLIFSLSMFSSPIDSMTMVGISATIIMGLLYVFTSLKMAMKQCVQNARRLLFVSIIYIPAILIILVIGNLGS